MQAQQGKNLMALPEPAQAWLDAGEVHYVDNTELFVRDTGYGEPLVCLHGFPTSSFDWHRLLPLLAHRFRIICFDFPGYGLSAKPRSRSYTIASQTDTAEALMHELGVDSFHLLAHDMGATVACELLHRIQLRKTRLRAQSVSILNAGLYMDLQQPLLTQRLLGTPGINRAMARLSSRYFFMRQYPRVYAHPEDFNEDHYESQWQLLIRNNGRQVLHKVAGFMRERVRHSDIWMKALKESKAPVRYIWGLEDPISVPAIVERAERELNPAAVVRLTGVGHYPQLEEAVSVYSVMTEWIE